MKITELTPDQEIQTELASRLSRIRKQQGLTQEQLADLAGLGIATLRRIEGGQDSQLSSWLKLLRALGMSDAVDSLLPENYRSPMAEALARQKKRRRKTALVTDDGNNSIVWQDELQD